MSRTVCKVALVTGSSAGVGKAVARELYARSFHVIISGRDRRRCNAVVEEIKSSVESQTTGKLTTLPIDLADFGSVRRAASQVGSIDVLVLNAGMLYHDKYKGPWLTKGGHDQLFASNHLGHFLLCELLLPKLKAAGGGRVVITTSIAHWAANPDDLFFENKSLELIEGEDKFRLSYARSKLANMLHAYELQRRLRAEGSDVTVTPIAPGLVSTSIFSTVRDDKDAYRHAPPVLQQNAVPPDMGALTTVHAVVAEPPVAPMKWCAPYWTPPSYCCLGLGAIWEIEKYLELNQRRTWGVHVSNTSPTSYDASLAVKMWDYSKAAVGVA